MSISKFLRFRNSEVWKITIFAENCISEGLGYHFHILLSEARAQQWYDVYSLVILNYNILFYIF